MILNYEDLGEDWFKGIIERFEREHNYSVNMPEYNNFKDYYQIIQNLVPFLEFPESHLLCFKVREMPKQLQILHFMTMASMYYQSIRELRYMFESVIQAYYIDKEHLDTSINCKLEVLKEIEKIVGSRLIDKTNLNQKNQLKILYRELSSYTHSSHKKIAPVFENDEYYCNIWYGFNQRLFKQTTSLSKKTIDAILFVLLSFDDSRIVQIKDIYNLKAIKDYELTGLLFKE